MDITVNKKESVCTLVIAGRLDTLTAPELDMVFKENEENSDRVIFDMSGVDYISSAGIRVLVSSHRCMEKKNGLVLKGVNSDVLSILRMTGLDKKLNIVE